jgi:hypothetical protein
MNNYFLKKKEARMKMNLARPISYFTLMVVVTVALP